VCLGRHERLCFVLGCHGIHGLFAGHAESVVFVCIYCADKFASKMHHLYPLTLKPRSAPPISLYLYLQRYQSRSTAQGVPPVVASGGLGHVIPSNNKTQLIQCTNMLVIVDFGGNAMSYLCARSKSRELKALHSQFGMLFGAMRLLPQTRQLFCYSKVAWVDTPRVSTPRLSSAPGVIVIRCSRG